MVTCVENLSLVNVSNSISRVATLVHEVSEGDKNEEFSAKIQFLHLLHSYVMEVAHWAYLFAVIDSPCAQLARLRRAPLAVSLPRSLKFTNPNDSK